MDAVLRLKGSTNLDAIQIIKKPGGTIKVGAGWRGAAVWCSAPCCRRGGRKRGRACAHGRRRSRVQSLTAPSPLNLTLLVALLLVQDSFLDEGFILDKRIGVGQPKRIEDAKILVANTGGCSAAGMPACTTILQTVACSRHNERSGGNCNQKERALPPPLPLPAHLRAPPGSCCSHGHRQDQDLRRPRAGGLHVQGRLRQRARCTPGGPTNWKGGW